MWKAAKGYLWTRRRHKDELGTTTVGPSAAAKLQDTLVASSSNDTATTTEDMGGPGVLPSLLAGGTDMEGLRADETSGDKQACDKIDTLLLEHVPLAVTLFDTSGTVVYQNQASLNYMAVGPVSANPRLMPIRSGSWIVDAAGDLGSASSSSSPPDAHAGGGRQRDASLDASSMLLRGCHLVQLFRLDPSCLDEMLVSFTFGQEWMGTVRLPQPGQVLSESAQDGMFGGFARLDSSPLHTRPPVVGRLRNNAQRDHHSGGGGGSASNGGSTLMHSLSHQTLMDPRFGLASMSETHSERSMRSCTTSQSSPRQWHSARPEHTRSAQNLHRSSDAGRRSLELAQTISRRIANKFRRDESPHGGRSTAGASSSEGHVWHSVVAKVVGGAKAGQQLILMTHNDVTNMVEAEHRATALLEAEHAILEQVFPRHVIERMTAVYSKQSSSLGGGPGGGTSGTMLRTNSENLHHHHHPHQHHHSTQGNGTSGSGSGGGAGSGGRPVAQGSSGALAVAGGVVGGGGGGAAPVAGPASCSRIASLCQDHESFSTNHDQVTIMFADIVGFTSMCKVVPPATVMAVLNKLYSAFDALISIYNVYKVETAGDCYIVAGGLMQKDKDGYTSVRSDVAPIHALSVLQFAKAMLHESSKVVNPVTGSPMQMRIGMHSGPVVSGIIGTKMPRFCLFGDSMNTAQRMESSSRAGCIHVSAATRVLLPRETWQATDGVELKGLGMCSTYFWVPQTGNAASSSPKAVGPRSGDKHQRTSTLLLRTSSCAFGEGIGGDDVTMSGPNLQPPSQPLPSLPAALVQVNTTSVQQQPSKPRDMANSSDASAGPRQSSVPPPPSVQGRHAGGGALSEPANAEPASKLSATQRPRHRVGDHPSDVQVASF